MSINLDMDIGELLQAIMSKKGVKSAKNKAKRTKNISAPSIDSPYKKPILTGIVITLLFAAFMAGVYLPYSDSVDKKNTVLAELQGKEVKINSIDAETRALERELSSSSSHYRDLLEYFGDHEDIGNLYESLSMLALENKLVVLKVREVGKVHKKEKKYGTVVKKAEVEVELEGSYLAYMNFKEKLTQEKTLLSVHSENIKVIDNPESSGKIVARLRLLTYTIDKIPFEKMISGLEKKREMVAIK
jgi:hypothetical protein